MYSNFFFFFTFVLLHSFLSFCPTLWDISSTFISSTNFSLQELFVFQTFLPSPKSFLNFYFLDALILLSERSVVLFLHFLLSASLFYPSCFSGELLLFFCIIHDRYFFRGLFSLLVWHGSELIRSSEQDRGACQLWPSHYGNVDGLFVGEIPVSHVSIFLSHGMFRFPRKESFRLCQERKGSEASILEGQFRRRLGVGALRI